MNAETSPPYCAFVYKCVCVFFLDLCECCLLQSRKMIVGVFFCSTSECLQGPVGSHTVVGKIKRSGWKSHCFSQTGLRMALSTITFNTTKTAAKI